MRYGVLIVFIFLFCYSPPSYAQGPKFNLKVADASIIQIFNLIQQQSEYIILYKDTHIDKNKKVSIKATGAAINEILDHTLENTGLTYKIFDRQIVIVPSRKKKTVTPDFLSTNEKQGTFQIRGRVTDKSDLPLAHVSIVVKGTSIGTITNKDGYYSLNIPKNAKSLSFSFIGMLSKEELILGNKELNVVLESDMLNMDDIIITALGLGRKEKSLTYATQKIDGSELERNRDLNFVGSLSGKVSGLDVNRSSSGAGGSTKIVLRGNKSLSGDSEPLFVIDGIPLANRKGGQPVMFGGIDEGDGLSQVNPNDIESISVLKGMNASILYGSQGANGVILLTTKRGNQDEVRINISSSFLVDQVTKIPKMQYRYGSIGGAKESWSYTPGEYNSSFVDNFFRTGYHSLNTISISGGNEITSAYFSYANTYANGIVPKNNYHKNNFSFKQSTQLFEGKLTVGSNMYLAIEKWRNRNPAGYYMNPLTGLYFFPRDRDFNYFKKNYQYFNEERNLYDQNWFIEDHLQSNPYWIINNQPKTDDSKRIIAGASLDYNIAKGLDLKARANYDYADKLFEQQHAAGSNTTNVHENGRWDYQKYADHLIYIDGIISYDKKIADFDFGLFAGGSFQKAVYGEGIYVNTDTRGLLYPNEFYFDNLIPSKKEIESRLASRLVKQAVFANLQLAYKETIFIDLAGRNDWASSLATTGNESYFYPALGIAGVVSEMFTLPAWINFAKLRASYSIAANEVPFNQIDPQHSIVSNGVVRNTSKPFSNMNPERLKSIEFGTDIRLFNGRLNLDASYYRIVSTNQFIALPSLSGSGYTEYLVNAGEIINKGFEFFFEVVPVKSNNWIWRSSINTSSNKNQVVSLHNQLKEPIGTGEGEGYDSKIVPGGSIGDIYVYKFKRDELKRIVLDETSGRPLKTATTELAGNLYPSWILGWNNSIDFKGLSMTFLVNGKFGGKAVSQTEAMLDGMGVSERSALARDRGFVPIEAIMGEELVTEIDPYLYYSTTGNRNGIKEPYVYDRTNVRLSQLVLGYNINTSKWNLPVKKVNLSFVAQNLFFIYLKAPFDPEVVMNTGRDFQSLDNFILPASRNLGFSVNLTF